MTSQDSSPDGDALLEAKRQLGVCATERLLAVCGEHESPLWLSRYREISEGLREGRVRDAIAAANRVADSAGVEYGPPRWVVSEKMAKDVRDAMCRVRMHVYYADDSDIGKLPVRPTDVKLRGTVQRRDERRKQKAEVRSRLVADPLDSDPQFAAVMEAVRQKAEANLGVSRSERFLGYCHAFWAEKKRILRVEYGIEWQSPSELNPGVIFD